MRKLEIGPPLNGPLRGNDWETLDVMPGVCMHTADWATEALPFPDRSFDHILASHVLEHIAWWQVYHALTEVRRLLKPGGRFEVWVPDIDKLFEAYRSGTILNDGWYPLNPERDPWKSFNGRMLWGARAGEEGQSQHFHKSLFNPAALEAQLKKAGFTHLTEATRPEGEQGHGWFEMGRIARVT